MNDKSYPPDAKRPAAGFIYLLHWRGSGGRVEHYVGWTADLEARLKSHFSESGGCPTTRQYRRAGMRGRLVRLWRGTVWGEKKLQQTLEFPRDCPVCCGKRFDNVACEGWVEADTAPTGPLQPWNRPRLCLRSDRRLPIDPPRS